MTDKNSNAKLEEVDNILKYSSSSSQDGENENNGKQDNSFLDGNKKKEHGKIRNSSSTSTSSNYSENEKKKQKKKWSDKKKELENEISELKNRLVKETSVTEHLRYQLSEETDAKERLTKNLKELQVKHNSTLKEEEALRFKLNEKDQLVLKLERENQKHLNEMEDKNKQRKTSMQILSKIKDSKRKSSTYSQTSENQPSNEAGTTTKPLEYFDSDEEDEKAESDSDHEDNSNNLIDSYTQQFSVFDITEQVKIDMVNEILNEFSGSPYILKEEMKDFVSRYQDKTFGSFIRAIDKLKDEMADLKYDSKKEIKNLNDKLNESKRKSDGELQYTINKHKNEVDEWRIKNEELSMLYEKEKIIFNQETEDKIKHRVEEKVKNRLKDVEKCVLDQIQLQSQIKNLQNEKEEQDKTIEEERKKYDEVLVTLQEVQDAYGDMRDVVLERYKTQVDELQDRVKMAEESNNENTITDLRQQVLDARLLMERLRQNHEDEFTTYKSKEKESTSSITKLDREVEDLKNEKYNLQNTISDLRTNFDSMSEGSREISEKNIILVNDNAVLEETIQNCKQIINDKEEQITELKDQIASQKDNIAQVNSEKAIMEKELEVVGTLKENITKLNEYIDDLKNQLKLKAVKVKYLKKQVKESLDQKQKLETLVDVLPEMQKQIDHLQADKSTLEKSIKDREVQEVEEAKRKEQEQKDEEERKKKLKEDWERKILGIGDCELFHEGASEYSIKSAFSRPGSAPPSKPRPPSSRRSNSGMKKASSTQRPIQMNATLPNYFSPEVRRIYDKRYKNENAYHLKKNNFFRTSTLPHSHMNSIKREDVPRLSRANSPRVLVWANSTNNNTTTGGAEGKPNRLLAIGDRVAANLLRQCDSHGTSTHEHSGVVKFIGFINGNHTDVYIGVRLDDEVGNTDGFIDGKRYFRCEPNRGKFVRYDDITKVLETKTQHGPLT